MRPGRAGSLVVERGPGPPRSLRRKICRFGTGNRVLARVMSRPPCPLAGRGVTALRERRLVARAKSSSNGAEGSESSALEENGESTEEEEEENFLMKFVQEVKPQVMDQFTAQASPQVVDAMKQTISNMLGSLPAKYFDVTIKTVGENLAQLMLSVMMTGYMFRNAQYRMDVTKTLALPSPSDETDEDATGGSEYAEGSQQINISGEVLRWHNEKGAEAVDAMEYIEQLERELSTLREQVSLHEEANLDRNYLLEFLQKLEPTNIREMTSGAGDEVVEAMNAFIKRLVGTDYDSEDLKGIESKSTSVEMARLLYWLLIVGYSLRTIEVRKELEKATDDDEEEEDEEEEVAERDYMNRSSVDDDDWEDDDPPTIL